jgi:putative ABC transport system permease protein
VRAFIPIGATRDDLFWDRGVSMGMVVLGRLKPGTSLEQARTEMTAIARALALQYPKENKEKGITIRGLREALVGDVRPALLMLLGAVAFVLLIACANVANLLLARSAVRQRELAIRSAIGAGSGAWCGRSSPRARSLRPRRRSWPRVRPSPRRRHREPGGSSPAGAHGRLDR